MKRILGLFPSAWDRTPFDQPGYEGRFEFHYLGEDLFHFPGNLQLAAPSDPAPYGAGRLTS